MKRHGFCRVIVIVWLLLAKAHLWAGGTVWVFHDGDPDYYSPPFDDRLVALDDTGRTYLTRGAFNTSQTIGGCRAIAVAGDSILVCENVANQMSKINAVGETVFSIARPINAVDVTGDGTIFGLEDHTGTINGENTLRISPQGEVLQQAAFGGFDLAIDESRRGIFVVGADIKYLDFDLRQVWKLDPIPWCAVSVDVASDGSAWVAEREHSQVAGSSNRLLRISPQGIVLQTIHLAYSPFCVRVDKSDDSVYVAGDSLYKYHGDGTPVFAVPLGNTGWSIAIDPAGQIWVGTWSDVRKFSANGDLLLSTNRFSRLSNTYVAASALQAPLSISDAVVNEGNASPTNALCTVRLATNHTEVVVIDFATTNGTARAGDDYLATNGSLSFSPGETEKVVTVPVLGDLEDETNETFFVHFTNSTNVHLIQTATVTIVDNDDPPGPPEVPRPALTIRASEVETLWPAPRRVSEVELSWPTVPAEKYALEYRASLDTEQWDELHSVQGDGNTARVYDKIAAGQPQRFYRVVVRRKLAYLTNVTLDTVTVVDLILNQVITNIPVAGRPHYLSASPDGKRVFVSVINPMGVKVIDVATQSVTDTVPVDKGPLAEDPLQRLATTPSPNGDRLFAVTSMHYALHAFGIPGYAPQASIPMNQSQSRYWFVDVKVTPAGDKILVLGDQWTWILDGSTYQLLNTVTNGGIALTMHPNGTHAYFIRAFLPVHVIDLQSNSKIDEITYPPTSGNYISAITVNPNGQYLYLLDTTNDELVVLSPTEKTLVKKLRLRIYGDIHNNLGFAGIAVSPEGAYVYVPGPDKLIVIETAGHTVTHTIPLGFTPPGNQSHAIAVVRP